MQKLNKNKLIQLLTDRPWMVQGFNGLPIYLHGVASNTGWLLKGFTGVNYSHFFLRSNESRAKYYYDESDLINIGNGYYKKNKSLAALNAFRARHKKDYLKARANTGPISIALDKLSLAELVSLAQKLNKELTQSIGITHAIEGISFVSEKKLRKILDDRSLNNQTNFQLLSTPIKPSFLSLTQTALWKIKSSENQQREKLIKNFLKNFGWVENNYVKGKDMSAQDVINKAKHQKEPKHNHEIIIDKSKFIKLLKLTSAEVFTVKTVEICTNWQDDRKKFLMQTIGRFEPVISEIAKRLSFEIENFKYICPKELTYQNLTNKKFLAKLRNRYPQSEFYALEKEVLVYSGKDCDFIEKALEKTHSITSELKGMIASKGKVKGRVRICRSIYDIPKVKKGEILVASMTRPEFLPAMQKAAGFITDEGGITSHAAIVSREMKKPCIIGTKIATEVLKDGDLVEVDAYKGIVKKL